MNLQFEKDIEEVVHQFQKLVIEVKDSKKILSGELDISDNDGKLWETYKVEIHETEKYPYRFPMFFEIGGKIPRIADWHVYSDTGSCCIDVPPSEIITCKNGLSVNDFILKNAIPYLANQTHRRIEGFYKNGEYSHGVLGFFEYYMPKMKARSIKEALKWMYEISTGKYSGRSVFHQCFCGSRKVFGKCHKEAVNTLSQIDSSELKLHIHEMLKFHKKVT